MHRTPGEILAHFPRPIQGNIGQPQASFIFLKESLSPRQPGSLSSYTPTLWIVNVTHTMKPGEFPSVAGARTQADLEENLKRHLQRTNPAK